MSSKNVVCGENVVKILNSREVSSLFTETVDPEELLPHLVPWFIIKEDKEKILAHRIQTGDKKLAGSNLRDAIVAVFQDRQDVSLKDLINALEKTQKCHQLISALEEALTVGFLASPARNDIADLVRKLKECYIDEFSSFKPLTFDEITFDLDQIWINLQLENTADLTTTESEGCIACLNVAFQKKKIVICKGEPGFERVNQNTFTSSTLLIGAGKATLSTYLCYKWAKEEWNDCPFDFVYLVPLRELGSLHVNTINEAVVTVSMSYEMLSDHLRSIEKLLKCPSKCLIIFDGYDEGVQACNQLESVLQNKIKGLPFHVLLTSRPWAVTEIKCPAQVVNICPLTSGQRAEYIGSHFAAIGKANLGYNLIALLETNPELRELSETALILCYLCFYYTNFKTVETNIHSLTCIHLHIIACLIDRYQTDKLPSLKEKPFGQNWFESDIMFNLGKMAFSGFSNSCSIFTESHIKEFDVDIDICISVGLLVRTRQRKAAAPAVSTYIYPHLTMQEFAASLFILRHYLVIGDYAQLILLLNLSDKPPINLQLLSNVLHLGISTNWTNAANASYLSISFPKMRNKTAIIAFIQ